MKFYPVDWQYLALAKMKSLEKHYSFAVFQRLLMFPLQDLTVKVR